MIPNLFSKKPLPKKLPADLETDILELKKLKTKELCLKRAYNVITKKYVGKRVQTYTRLHQLFIYDPKIIWKKKGFLHCTNQNYLIRILLVRSGKFSEKDIELKLTHIWGSPHQYLRINLGNKTMDIDCWAKTFGVPYGQHMYGLC